MYRIIVIRNVKTGGAYKEVELMVFDDQTIEDDLQLISPKLVLEDNDPGTLDFSLPPNHRYYNHIDGNGIHYTKPGGTGRYIFESKNDTVIVYKNGKWLWEGRPTDCKMDFNKNKTVHCEGALSYLEDCIQPLAHYNFNNMSTCCRQFLEAIIEIYNDNLIAQEEETGLNFKRRKIYVNGSSYITVTPDQISNFDRTTNFENTLETINKRLINKFGGHLRLRKNKRNELILDYIRDENLPKASQTVEFGKNLLEYNTSTDISEIATVIIPRGDDVDEESPFYRKASWCKDLSQKVDLSWWVLSPGTGNPCWDPRLYSSKKTIEQYGYTETVVEFSSVEAILPPSRNNQNKPAGWSTPAAYFSAKKSASKVVLKLDNLKSTYKIGSKTYPGKTAYRYAYLAALEALGIDYLQKAQFENLELEISIFDLGRLRVNNPEEINLLDVVLCSSKPHGMPPTEFPVIKVEVDLASIVDTRLTLGKGFGLKNTISNTAGVSARKVDEDPSDNDNSIYYKTLINNVRLEADGAIMGATKGYISIVQKKDNDNREYSDSIIISSDRLSPQASAYLTTDANGDLNKGNLATFLSTSADPKMKNLKFWIWNSGGLGYYDLSKISYTNGRVTGSTSPLQVGITKDGNIIANKIASEHIIGYTIEGCYIYGSGITSWSNMKNRSGYFIRIQGGEIKGGYDNTVYSTIDPNYTINDYSAPYTDRQGKYHAYTKRRGFGIRGGILGIDTNRVSIKAPKWCAPTRKVGGQTKYLKFISGFTGRVKGVMSTNDDRSAYWWGSFDFVNGICVGVGNEKRIEHKHDYNFPSDNELS